MENQADATLRGAAAGGMTLDELFGAVEQEWQDQALCAQTDPEAFFPEKGGSTREAKRICKACAVRDECLEYALEHRAAQTQERSELITWVLTALVANYLNLDPRTISPDFPW